MKITIGASSIVPLLSFFLLAGCDSIHVPNLFGHDEVPDEVKAQPRLVETPPPSLDEINWPRLGDVPFKPRNFSAKALYDRSMEELESERVEAETIKRETFQNNPIPGDAAPQDKQNPNALQPPQFLK